MVMILNSKIIGILSLFLALAIIISGVSAADNNLVSDDLANKNFKIDVPSGSTFHEGASTNLKVGDLDFIMNVYENSGNGSEDVNAILYFKDSSADKKVIDDMYNDLQKEGEIVEETDDYFIVKTQNNNWDLLNFNIGDDIGGAWDFVTGLFFGDSEVSVSANDSDVEVSNDGINIVSPDNETVSLSDQGLEVSDANGEGVSISNEGIKVSANVSENGTASDDVFVAFDENMSSNMANGEYVLCIKNPDNSQAIMLTGNNLDLMKEMADTASFSEK